MRSDRVLRRRAPAWQPGTTGRPPRHGGEFVFGDQTSWGEPDTAVTTDTRLYGPAMESSASQAHPPWVVGGPGREAAGDRRHRDPARCQPPPQRRYTETGVVVAFGGRPGPHRGRGVVAGVPAAFRYRAHLPDAPTDPRLGLPETAEPGSRRSVDLAASGRLHPTTPGPQPHHRSTAPLGETCCSATAYTRSCSSRVSAPPPESGMSGQSTETLPPRSRSPGRSPQPAAGTPLRRAHQDHQRQETIPDGWAATPQKLHKTAAQRLKLKLGGVPEG
ncbi:hypothetical protein [Nocardia sp. CNY236]|uniref:hypothetical protein n=1 Tax=Nocardia sp. CNY236 TaxID=1169152 RepID=UPI00350EE264